MERSEGNALVRVLASYDYEGWPIAAIEYRGAMLMFPRQVGAALGYADDGGRMISTMSNEWSDRLREGDHFVKLVNGELAALKQAFPNQIDKRTPSLLMLTERGLYRVLMLSGKPKALAFQDWLDGEVLPSIRRTGAYVTPIEPSKPSRSAMEIRPIAPGEDPAAYRKGMNACRALELDDDQAVALERWLDGLPDVEKQQHMVEKLVDQGRSARDIERVIAVWRPPSHPRGLHPAYKNEEQHLIAAAMRADLLPSFETSSGAGLSYEDICELSWWLGPRAAAFRPAALVRARAGGNRE
jgi:prophage antirepressor-like protein